MDVSLLLLLCLLALYLAFFFAALYQAVTSDLEPSVKTMWVMGILVFQFLGPLAWFLVKPAGRRPR